MKKLIPLALSAVALLVQPVVAEAQAWVEKSNQHAAKIFEVMTKYNPEASASLGITGYDDQIIDLKKGYNQRAIKDMRNLQSQLEKAHLQEKDAKVKQDLAIMIQSLQDNIRATQLQEKHLLPYFDLAQMIFFGSQGLLDPQIDDSRKQAIVKRLEKYAGIAKGYQPITKLAQMHIEKGLQNKELIGPYTEELNKSLRDYPQYLQGMQSMLSNSSVNGWQQPYQKLSKQLEDYYAWVAENVRPHARQQPQLPLELYQNSLKNVGVDWTPETLIERATLAFADIQNEMQALAPLVAKEHGFKATDYREVIKQLKDRRIEGDKVVDYYKDTLDKLETIIEREQLVTLPKRDADIQIADAARSAAIPSPHLQPPRLIGNTGEYPVFMIPQILQDDQGNWQHNDTTFEANAFTLTAHEARPGHELQFSSMIESGVSQARAIFAFNSANVEGWALYAEAITKPYMPLDAQMISLQNRLLRAGRMFLDPMINLGMITREQAKAILMEDVVIDEGFAQQEIDRYSFRAPGQATAYYYGYSHLQSLRTKVELALRDKFDARAYHDFILSQGLLPPDLLEKAVMEEFVPRYK